MKEEVYYNTKNNFVLVFPKNIAEVIEYMSNRTKKGKILAGGTDLIPMIKEGKIKVKILISLQKIKNLAYIKNELKYVKIGALTTIEEIYSSDIIKRYFASINEAAAVFGTTQIRNMGTIGGNIFRNSPASDMIVPLYSLGAKLKIAKKNETKEIGIGNYIDDYDINNLGSYFLREIVIEKQIGKYYTAFYKIGRTTTDLAKVSCCVVINTDGKIFNDIKITLGSVYKKVIRARSVEKELIGKKINNEAVFQALIKINYDIKPITDLRSTSEYRKKISKVIIARTIDKALKRENKVF